MKQDTHKKHKLKPLNKNLKKSKQTNKTKQKKK